MAAWTQRAGTITPVKSKVVWGGSIGLGEITGCRRVGDTSGMVVGKRVEVAVGVREGMGVRVISGAEGVIELWNAG